MMIGPSTQATVISATHQRRNVSGTAQWASPTLTEASASVKKFSAERGLYGDGSGPSKWGR